MTTVLPIALQLYTVREALAADWERGCGRIWPHTGAYGPGPIRVHWSLALGEGRGVDHLNPFIYDSAFVLLPHFESIVSTLFSYSEHLRLNP